MNSQNKPNLIIYQKYMGLIDYTNDIVRKYPKSETFALVKEIKSTIYGGLRHLLYAIKSYKIPDKLKYLFLRFHFELHDIFVQLTSFTF